jgi:hypothetical protein
MNNPYGDYHGNVTNGQQPHVATAREDVEAYFIKHGFIGTIGCILDSYKTREQLKRGE